jgi:hypothetical protein
MDAERRRDARFRVSVPAAVLRRSGNLKAEMIDASFRGLYVRMEHPPQVRELVKVRIDLPTGELIVHGVVVRLVEDHVVRGRAGVGLRFFALNGHEKSEWEQFMAGVLQAASRGRAA